MNVMVAVASAGAVLSIAGTAHYARKVWRGQTKPRIASWTTWTTANGVLAAVALLNHNVPAAGFDAVATLTNGSVLVLALSLLKRAGRQPPGAKRRDASFDGNDWACLVVSGVCLTAILAYPHATYPDALLAMAANFMATWPTIVHAWRRPKEEAWPLFVANSIAYGLGLLGVLVESGMSLGNIAGPLVGMLGNLVLVGITLGRGLVVSLAHKARGNSVKPVQLVGAPAVDAADKSTDSGLL